MSKPYTGRLILTYLNKSDVPNTGGRSALPVHDPHLVYPDPEFLEIKATKHGFEILGIGLILWADLERLKQEVTVQQELPF